MITLTGIIEYSECSRRPYVAVRGKINDYFDEALEDAKHAYEFTFKFNNALEDYEIVSVKKISKKKAKENPQ